MNVQYTSTAVSVIRGIRIFLEKCQTESRSQHHQRQQVPIQSGTTQHPLSTPPVLPSPSFKIIPASPYASFDSEPSITRIPPPHEIDLFNAQTDNRMHVLSRVSNEPSNESSRSNFSAFIASSSSFGNVSYRLRGTISSSSSLSGFATNEAGDSAPVFSTSPFLSYSARGGDILVTGFGVASNRRNEEFHRLFRTIPEGDRLVDGVSNTPRLTFYDFYCYPDYNCSLGRIDGCLYISQNYICFLSRRPFGWEDDVRKHHVWLITFTYLITGIEHHRSGP